jgi:hypothetical protein
MEFLELNPSVLQAEERNIWVDASGVWACVF